MNNKYSPTKNVLKLCCTGLLSLFVSLNVFAQTTTVSYTNNTTVAIPDNGYNGALTSMATSSVTASGIPAGSVVTNIEVVTSIDHTWIGDLTIKLVSPNGTVLGILSRPGLAETVDDGTGCCGRNDNLVSTSPISFSDLGAFSAESMGVNTSTNNVCATDGRCSYFPDPGAIATPPSTFSELYAGLMNGTWSLYIGDSEATDLGSLISWTLNITYQSNDLCADATPIFCGDAIAGSTINATTTGQPATCGTSIGAAGVWYVFTGTGQLVTASLCGAANYDSKMNVYSGSCGALTCVEGNDDGLNCFGLESEVVFQSVLGTTYYIYVQGFDPTEVGDFVLSLTCVTPPANDLCANAVDIPCASTVSGTTVGSTLDNAGTCVTGNTTAGVWYTVTGTGGPMSASTCNANSDYDTKLSVYTTTNCTSFTCVTGNDDDALCTDGALSTVNWPSTLGQVYYILVHGFGGETGDFDLTVNFADVTPPTITCPANISVNNTPGQCGATVTFSGASASDACSAATVTYSPASGSFFAVGANTVTATATDVAGNTATCTFTVTVVDNEAPVICANTFTPIASYNRPNPALQGPPFTVLSGGALTGRPFAFDGTCCSGNNPATDIFQFTVSVTGAYTINQVQTGAWDGYMLLYTNPYNLSVSPPTTFVAGSDDGAGGVGTSDIVGVNLVAGQTYYLISTGFSTTDNGAFTTTFSGPGSVGTGTTTTCQSNVVLSNSPGTCGATFNYTAPVGTDNCSATTTLTSGLPSGSVFPVGVTTVTHTATDAAGNSAAYSFTVTVNDTQAPVVTCPADVTVTNDPGLCSAVVSFTPTATDNCTVASVVSVPASGSNFPLGTTTVTTTATDAAGNSSSCTFNVTVTDNEGPTLSCPANISVSNDAGDCGAVVNYTVPTATDNCGITTINEAYTGPTINITDNATVTASKTVSGLANGATLGGSVSLTSVCISVNHTWVGDLTIRLQSPDGTIIPLFNRPGVPPSTVGCGGDNISLCIVPGTGAEAENAPCGNLPAYSGNFTAADGFNLNAFNNGGLANGLWQLTISDSAVGDVGALVSWRMEFTPSALSVTQTAGLASGATYPVGVTTNTFESTDAAGNTSSCSFTVTVADAEGPAIACPSDISVDTDAGACGAVVTFNATATDNCPGTVSVVSSPASGSTFAVGTTLVTVTATDASNNVSTCTFNVIVTDNEDPEITVADVTQCSPVVTYSATATDNCGVQSITYNPASGSTFPLGVTQVTVTATDVNGNTANATFDVTVLSSPSASISANGPTTFCADGSVDLTATGGGTYLWSEGSTTASITVDATDIYEVTVTGANGCTAVASESVTVTPLPNAAISASGSTTICAGSSVDLTASGGASYLWSEGSTTATINVDAAGTFSVTVTSADGCTATASETISIAQATGTITASGPTTFCDGGSVDLTATSGVSYLWSDGSTTQTVSATASGDYDVTITYSGGCTATATQNVVVNPVPTASITASGATTFCDGGSVDLTAAGGTSYLWSDGSTTATITASNDGGYDVTVSDANGCTASTSETVTVNVLPTASITASGSTTICAGSSVDLTASGGTSYLWSEGSTTATITVDATDDYDVTVTDANGCSATASESVTVNTVTASITASGATTFCDGESVDLTAAGGTSYLWSDGSTTATISASDDDVYSVTVSDGAGCTASSSQTVTVNSNPTAAITTSGPTTFCAGGSVDLTATGGGLYSWSNGSSVATTTATVSDTYIVTVTNANGCTATASEIVTVNPAPNAAITSSGSTTICTGTTVDLTATGGTVYLWDDGSTTATISGVGVGTYDVTVTDANGCSASASITINQATTTATITPSGPTTVCDAGSVDLTANGGVSYLWSDGSTTATISATASGTYDVTVTYSGGCTASASETVTINPSPTAAIAPSGATTFCSGGSVDLTASGGTSYLWSDGSTTSAITANATGDFDVTVTDANGCTASASESVTVNTAPTAAITASGATSFCQGGSVDLTASGGTSYSWSDASTSATITVSTSSTSTVTVTDANGCTASASEVVTVSSSSATITASGATTFCAGESVDLTASAGASYIWSDGSTTATVTSNATSTLSVTVTDANGCTSTASQAVTVNPNPTGAITPAGAVSFCTGGNVVLTASGGTSYVWSTAATTAAITVTTAGTYSVIVTDANGCTGTATSVVTSGAPTATVATTPSSGSTGTATVTASNGTSPYTYLWSNGGTTATISGLASGTYNVTVTDANGCTTTASGTVQIVGISEVSNILTLNLYPNPNDGKFNLAVNLNEADDVRISIYNKLGQLVAERTESGAAIVSAFDLTHLAAGTYHMSVSTSKGVTTKTFVIGN